MKRRIRITCLCITLSITAACSLSPQKEVLAYTQEEKQMVKDWLSAHGYAPTWDGAYQAYQDYLDGKFDYMFESQTEVSPETETTAETEKKEKKKKATDQQDSKETETQPESALSENDQTKEQAGASEIPPVVSPEEALEESAPPTTKQETSPGKDALSKQDEMETEKAETQAATSLPETSSSQAPVESESRKSSPLPKGLPVFVLAVLAAVVMLLKRLIKKSHS